VTYVYFILPYLGLLNSFFYLIYVLLTLGIVVQYKIEGPKAPRFYVILYLFLSVLIINHIYKNIFFLDFTSTNTAMREKSEGFSIEHLEPQMKLDGAMDSVRLLEDKRRNAFYLIGNGDITANWSPLYPTEHQMLATLTPLLAVGHAETPHNALIMGLKEGVMTDILLDIPSISAVTTIENEPAYIQIASQLNYYPQIFLNKASHVNTQDYRAYLHSTTGLFDLIVLNVDRYWKRNTAYFFTKEFYTLIKNHLSNEGVFSQDLDLRTLPTATLNTLLKTIHAVFPYTQLYMVTDNHMIVVSSISPLQNHFDRLFSNPKIDARLAKFAITSPNDLNARYFANEDLLDLYLQTFTQGDKGDNLFFDYFPFLEYESAHNLRSRVASSIPQIRWGVFPPLDYLFHDDVVSVDSIHINALSNVSKNYHTADAIYRYIKTGTQTKKGLPSDIVEALETLEVSDMAYCKDITERHIWLRAYAYLMEHTLPYLSKDKMKTIIDKMKKHPCHALYASAPDTVLEWISLHEALIANRYREMLGHATKIYDKTRNNIGTQIALTYILLAQVKLHQFSDAVKTWAEFPFKQSSSDVSRMLVRYATNQLQNTHNNNP
jgi:spermidine synthase